MTLLELILASTTTIAGLLAAWFAYLQLRDLRDRSKVTADMVSWDLCFYVAEDLLRRIKRWNPDAVVGIGRSGGIWGGWMAGNLGTLPFAVVDDKYGEGPVKFPGGADVLRCLRATHPEARKVLVIQGASSRGETFHRFKSQLGPLLEGCDVRFAVVFVSVSSDADIDFIGRVGPENWPDRMPWHRSKRWKPFMRIPRRAA